jgi:hypothetical protein
MEALIEKVLDQYGPPGLAIIFLVWAVVRLAKRLKAIEDGKDAAHAAELERERRRTEESTELVKSNIEAICKITSSMDGISKTLDQTKELNKEVFEYLRKSEDERCRRDLPPGS